jgi:hypothetical protein
VSDDDEQARWTDVRRALLRLRDLSRKQRSADSGFYDELISLLDADRTRFLDTVSEDSVWHTDGSMWIASNAGDVRDAQLAYIALHRLAEALHELGARGNQLTGNRDLLEKWSTLGRPDPYWEG